MISPFYSQMFRYYSSENDLKEALFELSKTPRLKLFQGSIQIYLSNLIPQLSFHLFSYEENETKYWLALKSFIVHFHIYTSVIGAVDRKGIRRFIIQVIGSQNGIKEISVNGNGMIFGDPDSTAEILSVLAQFGIECKNTRPVYMFSYPLEICQPNYEILPENFEMDKIREEDIEMITSIWTFAAHGEELQIKSRSETLPSCVIRLRETRELAAFAMIDHNGMIVGVNVLPEFRGKRFRELMMNHLAFEAKKLDIHPFYCCEMNNSMMTRWIPKEHKSLNIDGKQSIILISSLSINEDSAKRLQMLAKT